jgi:hypothetical protein
MFPTEAPRCVVKANEAQCGDKIVTVPPDPDCDCYVSEIVHAMLGQIFW